MVTLPIMMLGWIPFRAESIEATFGMWFKVININEYGFLSMRENAYLIAAVLLVFFILNFFIYSKSINISSLYPKAYRFLEAVLFCLIIPFIIIYLRPISQFIYFQF
jgi:hypothetical protein